MSDTSWRESLGFPQWILVLLSLKSDVVLVSISHYSMALIDCFTHFKGLKSFLWAYSKVKISLTIFCTNAFLIDARLAGTWTQKHWPCVHESFFVNPLHKKALLSWWLKHLLRGTNGNYFRLLECSCWRLSQLAVLLLQLFISLDLD